MLAVFEANEKPQILPIVRNEFCGSTFRFRALYNGAS